MWTDEKLAKLDEVLGKKRADGSDLYWIKRDILLYCWNHPNWNKEYFWITDEELYLNIMGDKEEIRNAFLDIGRVAFNMIFGERKKHGLIHDYSYDKSRHILRKTYGIFPVIKIRKTKKTKTGFFVEPNVDQLDNKRQKILRQAERFRNSAKNAYDKLATGCHLETTSREIIKEVDQE